MPETLAKCVVGIKVRKGNEEQIVEKPLACYYLYKGSLVDPHGTQIPLHRVACISCTGYGRCLTEVECEVYRGGWVWAVVCQCGSGKVVVGPRGYDPVYALAGPPYPLVYRGKVIACLPEGECKGRLVRREGVWYWYY